jgi:hypothetical protein
MIHVSKVFLCGLAAALLLTGLALAADPPSKKDAAAVYVRGTVIDEAGQPVAGAVVGVAKHFLHDAHWTKTAADGTFLLNLDVPALRYLTLRASAADGARLGLYRFVDTDVPLGPSAEIRITLKPARALTVRVTDGQARPVAGAAVAVFDEYYGFAGKETNAAGEAVLRYPADANVWWVVALKPGAGFDYFENYRTWFPTGKAQDPPAAVTLVLDGAQTVRIRVTNSAGQPLPGALLSPWTIQKKGKIGYANVDGDAVLKPFLLRADRQGVATCDWIPKGLKNGVTFLCASRGYHLPQPPHFDPAQPNAPLTARLLRTVRVEGKVTFPDDKPAAGILIQAEGRGKTSHYCRTLARTRADGTYALALYPEQYYIVAVTDDNWAAPSYTGFNVVENQPQKALDFRLGPGTLIQGKLTVGRDNKPAAKQTITLFQHFHVPAAGGGGGSGHDIDLVRWAETDKDGKYRLRVGSGEYKIWGPETAHVGFTVKSEKKIERDFHVPRLPRGPLRGVVINKADGKPVAGAVVYGESVGAAGHAPFRALADAKGRFEGERWRDSMRIYAHNADRTLTGSVTIAEEDEVVKILVAPVARGKTSPSGGR